MSVMDEKRRSGRVLLGQDGNSLVNLVSVIVLLFLVLKLLYIVYWLSDLEIGAYYRGIFNWFALPADTSKIASRPWTVLTHMFTHEGVFHLVANVLWLWVFGYMLQDMTGNRKLIPIFLYGGVAGAFFYILSFYLLPHSPSAVISTSYFGANAAVMAVAVATTAVAPGYRIFPMINGGIPLWIVTIIYAVVNFSTISLDEPAQYIAHIAGAATGFLFIYQMRRGSDWSAWMNSFYDWLKDLFNPDKKVKQRSLKNEFFYKVKDSKPYKKTPHITQQRIDMILDKINQQGYHFLTDEEKDVLRRAANDGDL